MCRVNSDKTYSRIRRTNFSFPRVRTNRVLLYSLIEFIKYQYVVILATMLVCAIFSNAPSLGGDLVFDYSEAIIGNSA